MVQQLLKTAFLSILFVVFLCFITHTSAKQNLQDKNQISTDETLPSSYYALVAGGSKGIGFAIAEALAKRKFNLILIARHPEPLENAKQLLESTYGISVSSLMLDLSKESSADSILSFCKTKNIHLKVLCNVAGFGGTEDFLKLPTDSLRYMIRLNLESPVVLTWKLLPLLEENAPSYILNVASLAGMAPVPAKNLYSSTKAALISFSHALRLQVEAKNISVSCLTPGPVFTKPEIIIDTRQKLGWIGMKMAVPPKKVGEIAVRKMFKERMIIVPGTLASISSVAMRIIPDRLASGWFYRIEKKRSKKFNHQ